MQPRSTDGELRHLAEAHAHGLLGLLGIAERPCVTADHPALAWRRAGLMGVTGLASGRGLVAPVAITAAADGALAAFRAIAPHALLPRNGALLLGERARLLGLSRQGATSANGSCRLLETCDGRIALNLPRPEDWEQVPALLGEPAEDWQALARISACLSSVRLLAQGRLLGLAIAEDDRPQPPAAPFGIAQLGAPRRRPGAPLAVDLSALWAGPLAGSLLAAAGARVIKVESGRRPDGARAGNGRFFDLLNAGKESVQFDFSDQQDLQRLRRLVGAADIVIESSRPRALAALGIDAVQAAQNGATWLSITAHGRTGDAANWIGFGDDAAVAAGLSAAMARGWGSALFAGDAIADPLAGITAALAGWASWQTGGGRLISLALTQITAHACNLYEAGSDELRLWQQWAEGDDNPLYALREA